MNLNEFLAVAGAFFQGGVITKAEHEEKLKAAVADAEKRATSGASSTATKTIEDLTSQLTASQNELASVKDALAKANDELKADKQAVADLPKQASAQAATILANAGVPAVTIAQPAVLAGGETFADVVKANVASGMSKPAAISAAIKSHPNLYANYRSTGGML